MKETDVVFMGGVKDLTLYDTYSATWVAWGTGWVWPPKNALKEMHARDIHSTGSFWCLTAGAKLLHEDPVLRKAVTRDIEGKPIKVPWLLDQVHQGTPSWFGCTNHPDFRAHLQKKLREAIAHAPKGIHIDDPSGTYASVSYGGGCFGDHCMRAFRGYLKARDTPELRRRAGVETFENFDYRALVRKHATTRKQYLKVQNDLPLRREFLDCQLDLAVDNIRQLRTLAHSILGPSMTLSVNAYYSEPGSHFMAFHPVITHMVAEVEHHAATGTENLLSVVGAYRQAEAVGKPLAATGGGADYAFIKEHNAVNLVKIWIALSYACGQRFMVPHPEHQWCHTEEKGTHWYQAPVEEFAPLYRFVGEHPELFNGFKAVGPLSPPQDIPSSFDTQEQRRALKETLERGDPRPLSPQEGVWVFPRAKPSGETVAHILNTDYHQGSDKVWPKKKVAVRIPADLVIQPFTQAALFSYDAKPIALPVKQTSQGLVVEVPELRIWGILEYAL